MSERWSFCSEYIHCSKCAKVVNSTLERLYGVPEGEMNASRRCWVSMGEQRSIVAGFAGGLMSGEAREMMRAIKWEVQEEICHPVRFAALYDDGSTEILIVKPIGDGEK